MEENILEQNNKSLVEECPEVGCLYVRRPGGIKKWS